MTDGVLAGLLTLGGAAIGGLISVGTTMWQTKVQWHRQDLEAAKKDRETERTERRLVIEAARMVVAHCHNFMAAIGSIEETDDIRALWESTSMDPAILERYRCLLARYISDAHWDILMNAGALVDVHLISQRDRGVEERNKSLNEVLSIYGALSEALYPLSEMPDDLLLSVKNDARAT
jgi:hypothetical protein